MGSASLLEAVTQRVRPSLCVAGHIHEGYGVTRDEGSGVTFVNAATCDLDYCPVNPPIVAQLTRLGAAAADGADVAASSSAAAAGSASCNSLSSDHAFASGSGHELGPRRQRVELTILRGPPQPAMNASKPTMLLSQ